MRRSCSRSAAQGGHHDQADDRVERAVTCLQAADARVAETLGQRVERPAEVKGVQSGEDGQGTGQDPLEGQEEKEGVGQGEESQAGDEGAALAEGHRVGPDGVEDVALMVADLLGQVAGGEGQGEEGRHGEAAIVDGARHRVAEEKVEGAAGQVGRGAQERPAFPIEERQGVEGAQDGDGQGQAEGARAEAAEEEEAQGQQGGRQAADLLAADTSGREDAGGLVGVGEVGGQAGPVVEQEDVRHQEDIGDEEDRQRPQVLHRRVADREGGAEQWRALENEDLWQTQAGQVACRSSSSRREGDDRGEPVRHKALTRGRNRRLPTSSIWEPSR